MLIRRKDWIILMALGVFYILFLVFFFSYWTLLVTIYYVKEIVIFDHKPVSGSGALEFF